MSAMRKTGATGVATGKAPARPGQVLARSAARRLDSLWLRVLAWQMRRVNRAMLYALDDRALRDIGMHRSSIEAAVRDIDADLARRKRAAIRRSRQGRWPAAGAGSAPQTIQGV
jgi:uncharacterized protein YjiS (DUF1127 family)